MICESGFGTVYHDGSGFADCDPQGSGNRLCSQYPKDKWCSECVYLNGVKPPKKRKFKVKNKDWVWCCGNKIPKEEEAVGCKDCF